MRLLNYLKSACTKCPYKLGQINTLVSPCPQCKESGYKLYKKFLSVDFKISEYENGNKNK